MADEFTRYVILLTPVPGQQRDEALVRRHVAYIKELDRKGRFVLGGPFEEGDGMIVLKASSLEEARQIAAADPFVSEGARTCTVRTWLLSCEENNHMGMG